MPCISGVVIFRRSDAAKSVKKKQNVAASWYASKDRCSVTDTTYRRSNKVKLEILVVNACLHVNFHSTTHTLMIAIRHVDPRSYPGGVLAYHNGMCFFDQGWTISRAYSRFKDDRSSDWFARI